MFYQTNTCMVLPYIHTKTYMMYHLATISIQG